LCFDIVKLYKMFHWEICVFLHNFFSNQCYLLYCKSYS